MKELIEKLSSYNLLNYLLPGALFAVLCERITSYQIVQSDIVIALFLYYFIGMVISRIGSLFLEPVTKWTKFVKFAEYGDFVAVAAKDGKLNTLSEANNTYRTLCSLFVTLMLVKLYEVLARKVGISQTATPYILFVLLFLLFAFAYRKQTRYIVRRVGKGKNEHC